MASNSKSGSGQGIALEQIDVALSKYLSRDLLKKGLLADFADIQDICITYLSAINAICDGDPTPEEFEKFLRTLDAELLEHLPLHIRSIKKLLPKAIQEVNSST